jgi:peptide-methionine (S)-S-oxide reductase
MAQSNSEEITTFGSGCFWCTEAIFSRLSGVIKVEPGYSGGQLINPTYKDVCTGVTGHAEVCQISFNPYIISFLDLLEVFWKTHDPTTLNRQGNDIGTQYRSVIFYHSELQKKQATEMKNKLNAEKIWKNSIITQIEAFEKFYLAENYHFNYYKNNPDQPYCNFVITPKIKKFEKIFMEYILNSPK